MKTIELYSLHPGIKSLKDCIKYYRLEKLEKKYIFSWNPKSPKYLLVSEQLFYERKYIKLLKKYYSMGVITIYWAGECIEPDMNIFDYAVCWDDNLHLDDRIARVPPVKEMFHLFVLEEGKNNICLEDAHKLLQTKDCFCNFIYSNPNAHPMRDQLFYLLSTYKRVDSFGKHLNNTNHAGTGYAGHRKDTTLLKKKSKFSIAAENATYAGYTSEKILTAFQAHTVPIYWGNPNIEKEYNKKAFINVHNFLTPEDLLKEIKRIDESDELWCQMICEPWETPEQEAKHDQQMIDYLKFLDHIFNQEFSQAHRVPVGFHPDKYKARLGILNSKINIQYAFKKIGSILCFKTKR